MSLLAGDTRRYVGRVLDGANRQPWATALTNRPSV